MQSCRTFSSSARRALQTSSHRLGRGVSAIALLTSLTAVHAAELSVTVLQVKSVGTPTVRCGLFADNSDYPFNVARAVANGTATASGGQATLVLTAPEGTYALACWHDANGNGQVDRNFVGYPTEGVGFGNDAPIRFGPPSFKSASVVVGGEPRQAVVKLAY